VDKPGHRSKKDPVFCGDEDRHHGISPGGWQLGNPDQGADAERVDRPVLEEGLEEIVHGAFAVSP